jgi:hypothetical protein
VLTVRIRTHLRRRQLDEQLANGADLNASPERSLRAAQLTSPTVRLKLANALVEAVGDARMGYLGPLRAGLRRRDAAIRESAEDLLALAARLRDGEPIDVRGAAMASRLLRDRSSPFHRGSGPDLRAALGAAHTALDSRADAARELAGAA